MMIVAKNYNNLYANQDYNNLINHTAFPLHYKKKILSLFMESRCRTVILQSGGSGQQRCGGGGGGGVSVGGGTRAATPASRARPGMASAPQ